MSYKAEIERAARLLREAQHAVALTGAGTSTPSGIPDFRSPGSGLWEQADPMEVASIWAFRRCPEAFYDWVRPLVEMLLAAEPNPGHLALARLEAGGWLKAVLTQNIDGLHQKAGSRTVLELHGHLREATCLNCYRVVPAAPLLKVVMLGGVPHCEVCGGVMKPNVIFFGEQLPVQTMLAAMQHVRQADVMLVAGSSLEVAPVCDLPMVVCEHGGHLIINNLQPTYADDMADVVIHGDMAEVLPRIAEACAVG